MEAIVYIVVSGSDGSSNVLYHQIYCTYSVVYVIV